MLDVCELSVAAGMYIDADVLALTVSTLLVAALFLTVFGSALARDVAEAADLGIAFRWAWELVTWPLLTGLVLATCALVYYFAPDVEQSFRWISAGAIIATALWVLFTVIYSIYVNRFASYQDLYGALAGIVALMAYFYSTALILLLGAEMNQVIEQTHP
jgi:membrane protein